MSTPLHAERVRGTRWEAGSLVSSTDLPVTGGPTPDKAKPLFFPRFDLGRQGKALLVQTPQGQE